MCSPAAALRPPSAEQKAKGKNGTVDEFLRRARETFEEPPHGWFEGVSHSVACTWDNAKCRVKEALHMDKVRSWFHCIAISVRAQPAFWPSISSSAHAPSLPSSPPPAQERVGAAEKARDAAHACVDDLYRAAKAEL